jgi:DNA-binding CsgD family transcriptional regulator
MTLEERALSLIERIYEAAIEPDAWGSFVSDLSEAFGGAGVVLFLRLPGSTASTPDAVEQSIYRAGLLPELSSVFFKHFTLGLPWGDYRAPGFRSRFALSSEVFPDELLPEHPFYKEYMEPQGLAPEGPIVHFIYGEEADWDTSGIAIYRRVNRRPFDTDDLALGNMLVPHLARAFNVQRELGNITHQRQALAEVMDRLPTGVVLIDARHRPIVTNRTARSIAAQDDGFRLDADSPRAHDPQDNTVLMKLMISAVEAGLKEDEDVRGRVMSINRPSGKRPYVAMITPLLRPLPDSAARDAAAALFVGDPDSVQVSAVEMLETLYSLTPAEAELVALLTEGNSLEEAANRRGITMNTARSQLKQVFAKTETRRQGELVQLVLSGIATIRED